MTRKWKTETAIAAGSSDGHSTAWSRWVLFKTHLHSALLSLRIHGLAKIWYLGCMIFPLVCSALAVGASSHNLRIKLLPNPAFGILRCCYSYPKGNMMRGGKRRPPILPGRGSQKKVGERFWRIEWCSLKEKIVNCTCVTLQRSA